MNDVTGAALGESLSAFVAEEGREPGRTLLVTAGVHGDEYSPMAAVLALRTRLRGLTFRGTVVTCAVVNEGAFVRGARTAADGRDLARTCPGRPDGSETERLAFRVSRYICAADIYVDLHSGGTDYDILPFAGYLLHQDSELRAEQRRLAGRFGLPLVWGTEPSPNGRTLSVARDAGIPAIYAEYGSSPLDDAAIEALVDGCLNVMAACDMLDAPSADRPEPCIVEQAESGSGHLQAQHPASTAGFFAPGVYLGARVSSGESLGTIYGVDGPTAVSAERAGRVIALRARPQVDTGDGLAVVIPVSG